MNVFYNYNNKRKTEISFKNAYSSNKVQKEKNRLPSLKMAVNKENIFKNGYLGIINKNIGKKKNHSQLHFQGKKNRKPFSGNPLKFHKKNDLNNIGNVNKYYQERDIFTANPYLVENNMKKKSNFYNNNYLNELYNKYLIYFSNKKEFNNTKKLLNKKCIQNNKKEDNIIINQNEKNIISSSNSSLLSSNEKFNNQLISQNKNYNTNRIVIIANNKSNKDYLNTKIENNSPNQENEENINNEHLDLYFISYSFSEDPNLEHRKEMEDFHYIKALLNKKLNCSYFGLFDGHSGKEVGIYLMENLHKIIYQEIKNNNVENSEIMENVIKNAFEKIDKEINNQDFSKETGSTGTVLLLFKDKDSKTGKSLICANVGDSKAYLISKKEIKLITKDHICSDSNEVKRIRDNGGIVFRERVFGTLMLTRSFGDKEMKKYGVLSTPDIFCHNIEEDDLFVIIASDGVWDVIEEDEIFKMTKEKISSNVLSKKIIQLAKDRDTNDNISCIVVKLNRNN